MRPNPHPTSTRSFVGTASMLVAVPPAVNRSFKPFQTAHTNTRSNGRVLFAKREVTQGGGEGGGIAITFAAGGGERATITSAAGGQEEKGKEPPSLLLQEEEEKEASPSPLLKEEEEGEKKRRRRRNHLWWRRKSRGGGGIAITPSKQGKQPTVPRGEIRSTKPMQKGIQRSCQNTVVWWSG